MISSAQNLAVRQAIQQIAQETQTAANTAVRVGTALELIYDTLLGVGHYLGEWYFDEVNPLIVNPGDTVSYNKIIWESTRNVAFAATEAPGETNPNFKDVTGAGTGSGGSAALFTEYPEYSGGPIFTLNQAAAKVSLVMLLSKNPKRFYKDFLLTADDYSHASGSKSVTITKADYIGDDDDYLVVHGSLTEATGGDGTVDNTLTDPAFTIYAGGTWDMGNKTNPSLKIPDDLTADLTIPVINIRNGATARIKGKQNNQGNHNITLTHESGSFTLDPPITGGMTFLMEGIYDGQDFDWYPKYTIAI